MKTNTLLFSFLFLSIQAYGQMILPDQYVYKYKDGNLMIRWEPQSMEDWHKSKEAGYTVEIREVNGTSSQIKKVSPLPYEKWDKKISEASPFKTPFYQGSMNLLYPDKIKDEEQKIIKALPGQNNETLDSFRLGLLLYSNTYDFDLVESSGLGTSFPVEPNKQYQVKIYVDKESPISFAASAEKKEINMTQLKGKWGDRQVELEWKTSDNKKDFYGYVIYKSEDGLKFNLMDSLPHVNNLDEGDNISVALQYYSTFDSLEVNYKDYYYRLRGMDYFGDYSKEHSDIMGQGFDKITLSPALVYADQTDDNKAHLKWQMPDKERHLVKDYTIWRADSLKGKYEIALDSISPEKREIKFPLKHTINYLRIEANPKDGPSLSSMPVLVMGQDSVPPLTPKIISAVLDSADRVVITWHANTESDLWGYRIYKSNYKKAEFSLLNSYPTLDTIFIDTINVRLGTENIFYLLQAADKRNNRSPFSDTIRIEIPDVIPPASPLVTSLEQRSDSIKVNWVKSPSEDVVLYSLFRRNVGKESAWTKIAEMDSLYPFTYYIDTEIEMENRYAYTITAKDEVGLESTPEHFKNIFVKKVKEKFVPVISINHTINEEDKTITLTWDFNNRENLTSVLVYRGFNKDMMGKYKLVDAPKMSLTDAPGDYESVYYILKPSFKGQIETFFSETVKIDLPFNEKNKE